MARAWLFNGRGIAGKVKNPTQFYAHQVKDCGAYRECPNCLYRIDNSDVSQEWPGLPAGVKFDPTDEELLEHLAGKVGLSNSTPHLFIEEFIPTIDDDGGICYTHPENLPGAKKDGSSVHFFHRTSKAYATGQRKRRKICGQSSSSEEHVRWHKTGVTKPVIVNGVKKGFKKIMVLYKSSKKGFKPDKSNWVMHQFHLGTGEDEKEGEYVVSKVLYQQEKLKKKKNKSEVVSANEEPLAVATGGSPTTPKTYTPNPPRLGKRPLRDEINDENVYNSPNQVAEHIPEAPQYPLADVHHEGEKAQPVGWAGEFEGFKDPDPNGLNTSMPCMEILDSYAAEFVPEASRYPLEAVPLEDENANPTSESQAVQEDPDANSLNTSMPCMEILDAYDTELVPEASQYPLEAVRLEDDKADHIGWACESQAVQEDPDPNGLDTSLLCGEILDSYAPIDDMGPRHDTFFMDFAPNKNDVLKGDNSTTFGISDLANLDFGTPPDMDLADLQLGSQESITGWLNLL